MRDTEYEEVEATLVRVTDAAVLLAIEGEETWIPRSLLEDETEIEEAETLPAEVVVGIAAWKLRELGL